MNITINGHKLTPGQETTFHVALQSFRTQMGEKFALGDDETGEDIRLGYCRCIDEIIAMYIPDFKSKFVP
jgi:hypothetical protein